MQIRIPLIPLITSTFVLYTRGDYLTKLFLSQKIYIFRTLLWQNACKTMVFISFKVTQAVCYILRNFMLFDVVSVQQRSSHKYKLYSVDKQTASQ
jgi:hypothetical protein